MAKQEKQSKKDGAKKLELVLSSTGNMDHDKPPIRIPGLTLKDVQFSINVTEQGVSRLIEETDAKVIVNPNAIAFIAELEQEDE